MKRRLIFLTAIFGIFFLFNFSAHAQEGSEIIRSFDVTATIHEDSSVNVTERIVYDFGTTEHHGIFRDIPVKYDTKLGNQSIRLSDIQVVDELGKEYDFKVSSKGKNREIKIGDPDETVTGVKVYVISYKVQRAIGYFKDHDELYWNATGNGWPVPIESASLSIIMPFAALPNGTFTSACYYGAFGSATQCDSHINSGFDRIGLTGEFTAPRQLDIGEGLTGAFGFPKGLVHKPTAWEIAWQFAKDNFIVLLPIGIFVWMLKEWLQKGRNPKGSGTIIAEYEAPDGLMPLEVSSLMHEGVRAKDISAEIIHAAVAGLLTIERTEEKHLLLAKTDYIFHRKQGSKDPSALDALLVEKIFGEKDAVKLSDLSQKFYTHVSELKKSANNSAIEKGYFDGDPLKIRNRYFIYGALFFVLIWVVSIASGSIKPVTIISIILSGIIVIIFANIMPRLSAKGVKAREAVLGLKEYLQIAEKDRIDFHNAPEKSPKLFEKLLPYAMVLGVEKAWAKEFEDIYTTPPSWYSDPSGSAFNALVFTNNISSFSSAAVSNLTTAPGSSSGSGGGGFSGGGGGGGGGGSW